MCIRDRTISLNAILNSGDEVIVFAPFFPEYAVFVEKAGGILKVVNGLDESFQIDFDRLEVAITKKTKAILINFPNNPTGKIITEDELKKLSTILSTKEKEYQHNIYLISDEPYRESVSYTHPMKEYTEKIRKNFLFLSYAPIVFVSALKNQRIQTLFEQIKIVSQNYTRRLATNVLNDILLDASLMNQAPIFNGDRIKIYYGSQVEIAPPTFVLFVNDPNYMHFSYQRYLENRFREAFMLEGTPIKIILRKREN